MRQHIESRQAARRPQRHGRNRFVPQAALAAALGSLAIAGVTGAAATGAGASSGARARPARDLAHRSTKPFRVLMLGGLTGPDAADATAAEHGMQAGVDYLNAHGGIVGHHIVFRAENDQAESTLAVTELSGYLSSGTPNLVWPGSTSTEGLALASTLTRDKILANGVVSAPTVVNPSVNPYFFNVTGPLEAQGRAEAKFLESKHIKKVGFLYENFIIGTEEFAAESKSLTNAGITVDAENYEPTALNVTPQMQRLQSDGVQAVVLDGLGQPVGLALQARATLGWNVPVIGDALTSGTFDPTGVPASDLSGVKWLVQASDVYTSHPSAAFKTFYSRIQRYGKIDVPLFEYAAGWDVMMLSDLAAIQAKSIAGPAMARALENLHKVTSPPYVLAPYEHYSSNDHALAVPLAIVPMAPPEGGLYLVPRGKKP